MELLLLHFEMNQLRWVRHLARMLSGQNLGEIFQAHPTGRRPQAESRIYQRDLSAGLGMPLHSSGKAEGSLVLPA